ncbi:hypothetical protein LJB86_02260 [Deltaproteobacteria bacterium OttesenSCG-928-M10]|nr:hypothetical protein [Deltaproteobacteria bacterium OttesenSCG-928-M10]
MNKSGQEVSLKGSRKWLAIFLSVLAGLALAFLAGRSALDNLTALQRPGSQAESPSSQEGKQ